MRKWLLLTCAGLLFTTCLSAQQNAEVNLSPNPFASKLNIQVSNLEEDTVSLRIYDIWGRSVGPSFDSLVLDGSLHIIWPADTVEDGLYLVRTTINEQVILRRVIKAGGVTGLTNAKPPGYIKIFPNPAREKLSIKSGAPIERVVVQSSSGTNVKVFTSNFDRLDVRHLASGVYLFRIRMEREVIIRKVIIQ